MPIQKLSSEVFDPVSLDQRDDAATKTTACQTRAFRADVQRIIDEIIKEPAGGAHQNPEEMAKSLKRQLKKAIAQLQELSTEDLLDKRAAKYNAIGKVHLPG